MERLEILLIRWVNDGSPDFMGYSGTYNDRALGRQFMTAYADGKADFKFVNDKRLDVTSLEQVNYVCVLVEDPSLFSNVHNGQVYPASSPEVVQYKVEGVPMRMRFYKVSDKFAVIGQIASLVRTMEDGIGKLSVQSTLGMIKVPIQKINLNLRVEKNDESGNKLAGVDMALHKYKTVTAKHVAQQVTPTPIAPTVTGQQVVYRTHVQNVGWQPYVANATMSGTSGRSLRLEGLRIKLNNQKYNGTVLYRTHIQNIGWLGWAKNGESADTAGFGYRLEEMQIVLVEKGQYIYQLNQGSRFCVKIIVKAKDYVSPTWWDYF